MAWIGNSIVAKVSGDATEGELRRFSETARPLYLGSGNLFDSSGTGLPTMNCHDVPEGSQRTRRLWPRESAARPSLQ